MKEAGAIELLDVLSLLEDLGFSGRFFLTRHRGSQAYERLKDRIQARPKESALLLSFPQEQLIDVSFLDETIIRLGEEMIAGQCPKCTLLLLGLTSDTIANLKAAIELRHLKLAFLAVEAEGQWQCVGQLELSLRETLKLLWERGKLTAPELSEQLELAINSASNRLKRLYDLQLVRREYEVTSKGLQYVYYFWQWDRVRPNT